MSKVKTVIVFLKFKIQENEEWTHTAEYGTFGHGLKYETADDFLTAVRDMHRGAKVHRMELTNVVIG